MTSVSVNKKVKEFEEKNRTKMNKRFGTKTKKKKVSVKNR